MFMTKMFWRSWESTFFLSPSSLLVSCELFVSMRVIHQKQLKLSELYATLYNSLCRCLIPPLYTMFMPTTLCRIKYFFECFRWLLYAVLCRFIPMRWQFHTLLYTALCHHFSLIQFFPIIYSICCLLSFLRRLRSVSSQKTQTGPVTGQNKIFKKPWKLV